MAKEVRREAREDVPRKRFVREIENSEEGFPGDTQNSFAQERDGKFLKVGVYVVIGLILIFIGLIVTYYFNISDIEEVSIVPTCGDGSLYSTCSLNKPYYCSEGMLIRDAISCGCPDSLEKEDNFCTTPEFSNDYEIALKYILHGEEKFMSIPAHTNLSYYLGDLPRTLFYEVGEIPRRDDFKLMKINDEIQRQALIPMVVEIQNTAPSSIEDQARIAISLVQNLKYGEPEFIPVFGGRYEVRLSRYPYQVIYEETGSCEGKSELLALLLREIGFGVAVFHYNDENHEALGIKCPVEYSLGGSGYCFVETTVPAPIAYSAGEYLGIAGGKLRSEPELVILNKGFSLPDGIEEYEDSMKLNRISKKIESLGRIDSLEKREYERLNLKYGLWSADNFDVVEEPVEEILE